MSSEVLDYKSPSAELPLAATEQEIRPLTSLRFVAAAIIMIGHSGGLFGLPAFLWQSTQAVAFFFVLSGFVLTCTYPSLAGVGTFTFYRRRFARIWPLYAFAVLLALLVDPDAALAREGLRKAQIALNFLMMQVWVLFPAQKGGGGYAGLNLNIHSASWTISTLWALYLLFPLIIRNFEKTWLRKVLLAFASVVTMILLSKFTFIGDINVQRDSAIPVNNLIYWHFLVRIFEFVLGMAAAHLFMRASARWRPGMFVATLLELVSIGLVAVSVWASKYECGIAGLYYPQLLGKDWATWFGMGGLTNFSMAFLIFVFAFNRGVVAWLLSLSLPVLLGSISYAIFLIHPIIVHYIRSRKAAFPPLPNWVMITFMLIVTIYSAHLMWLLIERPMRRLIRGEWNLPKLGGGQELTNVRAAARVAEAGALAVLLGVGLWMAHYRPNIDLADENDLKAWLSSVRPETRNVKFGDRMVMLGARTSPVPNGLLVRIAWRSEAHQSLNYTVALHLIESRDGAPYDSADYKQDAQSIVDSGMEWRDVAVTIPAAKLKNAYALALGLKGPDGELLPVEGYPTDWDGKRLLILLK